MTRVRVIKDWDYPDLMQQTPGHSGAWGDIEFTLEPIEQCDFVIVFNRVPEDVTVLCAPENIWVIIQEPPVREYEWLRAGFDNFARVYTPDTTLQAAKYIHSHPALPWHVLKSYDFLKQAPPPDDKSRPLAWITSNLRRRAGHRARMAFLDQLRATVSLDLWGRGFTPIDDKWDGLAPYRYALAVENHSTDYYWTEKLADCYLSWTMPIYYGCTNIDRYFPPESMIKIDITKPDAAIETIRAAIESDLYRERRDAIAEARQLILDKYQFFPYIAEQIQAAEQYPPQVVHLNALPYNYPYPWRDRLRHLWRRVRDRS